ncbi:hypothetical protein OPT61_g5299 [Boeremia exigua]|uniref:Uncharacterized protein n=1 Tax=Boeremia exigua TaxID=749465 RepID=A0ACC2IAQ9_9PLEO|nr:hypothetical protein OPT61_g5299 [Boeremia exigua]
MDVSLQGANPLANKVFHTHADFRVDSIEDVAPGQFAPAGAQLQPNAANIAEDADKKSAALMRMWWDEAMAKHMVLSEGYAHVSVLIIRWADYLDDLKTKKEAQELEQVFRERFRYETETVELNVKGKPQLQLNSCVSAFAEKHNGPNNLLIIYYTGHGVWREAEEYLQLTAAQTPFQGKGFQKDAHANWNRAEQILKAEEIDSDVLTILDTCFSSNIAKSAKQSLRKFELLSACPHNGLTSSPGARSFTRVLIDKLTVLANEYKDKPFSTFHLNSLICMDERRHDTPSQLWFRLPNEQNILLAPLKPSVAHVPHKPRVQLEPRGYLTLRFALKDEKLSQPQIEYLAQKLSKAFENKHLIGLRKIDWVNIKPAAISPFERVALAAYAVTQWKKAVQRSKDKMSLAQAEDGATPMEVDTDRNSSRASPTRKRSRDADGEPKVAKRQNTESSQPPPSPVSISSRGNDDL